MRFIYCIGMLGLLALCAVLLDGSGHVLLAQAPPLPSQPARPVPWGSFPVIAAGCVGYAVWRITASRHM